MDRANPDDLTPSTMTFEAARALWLEYDKGWVERGDELAVEAEYLAKLPIDKLKRYFQAAICVEREVNAHLDMLTAAMSARGIHCSEMRFS